MTFDEILGQVLDLLQRQGRVSYRALKLRFNLDDEFIEGLKDELIAAQRLASDEDGKVLVWVGGASVASSQLPVASPSQPPAPQASDSGLRSPDSRRQTLDPGRDIGERRQLTVMFCDLVGSTALSAQLDPEELRDVVRAYQQTSATVIERYEGQIAQYLGDGLLVYFGYPMAHEDDAPRAVRAGLGIVEALRLRNIQLQSAVGATHASPLQVRIGIHTGPVVVSEIGGGGKREQLALGETPNIAARLQSLAEPDTVVLSAATHRLVADLFDCQDLGPQTLKGISIPLSVYRVMGEGIVHSRFEAAVSKGLTPLVGRDEELRLLQRRWEQAKVGEGQVVLLSGEPGIGKSRLVQMLKEQVSAEGATRIEFRCSAYHQNSAFYPLIEHLQRLLQFAPHDTPQAKLAKLTRRLASYRFPQADTLPLLAVLLSLPHPEGTPPLTLSPQKQKQKTEEALVAWVVEDAARAAVYCAWEDLHWADPSTLDILTLVLDQVPTSRLLALLTFRPDFTSPWRPHSHITQLTLSRLGQPQVEAMVERVTGGKALPAEVLQQIVRKTDGVPLFVEELTKMVLESGLLREADNHYELTSSLPPLAIPSTLQDSLMARLDRLSTVREIVQLGATLGREFSYELLHAVLTLDEGILQQGLRQLVEAEVVYQRGLPPQTTYLFKHALIQDAAYQSLLKSTRQQYHRQIAQILEGQFPETTETQPELLAHHYTEAGLVRQAITYWHKAGQRASQRSAHLEAISHLTKGLELLKVLPDTPERAQQELAVQIALGAPLMATKGYAARELGEAYRRAQELCQQMGETPQLFPVLWGLWSFYLQRAEHEMARKLGEQLLSLAQGMQEQTFLSQAHYALACCLFYLGEFASARVHLEQGLALYDPQQQRSHAFLYGHEPKVTCRTIAALAWWMLGYPDHARDEGYDALTQAYQLSNPFRLAWALNFAAMLSQYRREGHVVKERAEAEIALSSEQGFPYWAALGAVWRGWALGGQGKVEEGVTQVRQGLTAYDTTGAELSRPHFLALLAEACAKVGRVEEGLTVVRQALAVTHKTGERYYEAELHRLKGTLTLKQSGVRGPESEAQKEGENSRAGSAHHDGTVTAAGTVGGAHPTGEEEAEEYFLKAVEVARKQQAKSLELRAVMSLSRLWQQQGKRAEAQQMLAEIYGWFTEGFDTADLKEARALLKELQE